MITSLLFWLFASPVINPVQTYLACIEANGKPLALAGKAPEVVADNAIARCEKFEVPAANLAQQNGYVVKRYGEEGAAAKRRWISGFRQQMRQRIISDVKSIRTGKR